MKKYFFLYLSSLLSIFFLGGCKKYLREKGFSSLDATIFPKTEGDLRVLCNGMYINMEQYEGYGRSYYIMSDVFSDEAASSRPNGPRYEIENFLITPSNTEVDNWWTRSYLIIGTANTIIQVAPTTPIAKEKIAPYVAEAKFIRALTYFQMLRFFGDVPLVLSQPTNLDSLKNFKPSRAPQQDVYKQVVEDLIYAEANLPREKDIPANYKGTPSTGAASSLLAKVYLTRGYLSFADPADFQNAADECSKVINSGDYDLFPDYADVFDVFKKNGIEHIFSVQFDLLPNQSNAIVSFLSPPEVYPLGFASFSAERKFYNSFPDADAIRKNFNFYSKGVGYTGIPYDYISDPNQNVYCAKWRDPEVLNSNNDRTNYIFLRFADVLLMQSEALKQIKPRRS